MKINERSQQIIFLPSNLFFKVVIQHRKNEIDFFKNNYFLENETDTQLYGYAAFFKKNIYIKNGKLIFSGQKMRKDRFMKFRVLLKFSSFQTLLFVYGMFCKRQLNLNNPEVSYD